MKRAKLPPAEPEAESEVKVRIPVWLYPSTLEAIDRWVGDGGYKSRSEFIERAAQFYAGYLSGQDARKYLPPALATAIQGTVQSTEDRIARLLFKLAVEMDVMMNVLAAAVEIDREAIREQRGRSVQNVKKTGGSIRLEDAVENQRGGV